MKKVFFKEGYIDSAFLTITTLLKELDIPFTYDYVKNNIIKFSSYPYLNVEDLSSLLESKFKIRNKVIRLELDRLSEIILPAIAFLKFEKKCYVVITEIDSENVKLRHPYNGDLILTEIDLLSYWTDSLILIYDYDENFKERNYLKNKKKQDELIDKFKNNHIKLIPNFLNPKECDVLCSEIERESTKLPDYSGNFVVKLDEISPAIYNKILAKIIEITRKNKNCIEPPICIRYSEGKQNSLHYDVLNEDVGKYLYSFVIYLNDNFKEGETYFPQFDYIVKPVKGCVLMFRNFDEDMKTFDCSVHAGRPTLMGIKYTCNIWISTYPIS